ncbi:hypothetical protein [Lacticaseibacillus saniviri]|uniref:hypothetical protein n=1 Tax=Lacticaseibacillus saniviri TaxID=931533 RepID=UPI0006CF771E|nr:hypothetical protein [Lacticaseibacillus saniviri]
MPSNFGFDGENFRATFTDVGVTLFDGPGTIQDGNTSIFNVSAENLKPFVDWLNANMEAAK